MTKRWGQLVVNTRCTAWCMMVGCSLMWLALVLVGCHGQSVADWSEGLPAGMAKWAGSGTNELQVAARRGDAGAQYVLGWRYYHGEGVGVDQDLGLRWLRQAASNNVSEAQLQLGILEEHGIGRPVDREAALGWYERAARGSNVVAEYRAGELYLGQAGISNHFALGTNWLGKAAGAGYGPAQAALAHVYETTFQPSPVTNKSVADHWGYAVRGYAPSQFSLGVAYQPIDLAESYKWVYLAAQQNHPSAKLFLEKSNQLFSVEARTEGLRRAEAFKPDPSPALARRLYEQAADQGVPEAEYQLARALFTRVNEEEARIQSCKWLMLASAQGDGRATAFMNFYGQRFTETDVKTATRLVKDFKPVSWSAEWQHSDGLRYFFPVDRILDGHFLARLEKDAAAGDVNAQLRLGLYYQHEPFALPGKTLQKSGKTTKSRQQLAQEWCEKAAKKGQVDAQLQLAFLLLNKAPSERNLVEGRRLLDAAAPRSVEALYQLAHHLEVEGGKGKFLAEQLKYYRLAAEQGHPQAQVRLQALQTRLGDAGQKVAASAPAGSHYWQRLPMTKLGIVITDPALAPAADLLTATLSQNPKLTVLERSQLEKVFAEQSLARNSQVDLIKVGNLLSADGLILLDAAPRSATNRLMMQIIAVKPGVIINEHLHPWPLKERELPEWTRIAAQQLMLSLAKLKVAKTEAIPLSILNLRAAVASPEAQSKETQLTWLLTRRLVQQPEFFVLDRTSMDKLADETALGQTDTAFWNGSYTLEGIIDSEQINAGMTTIDVRLASPRMSPKEFRVSGPSDGLPVLAEQITTNVIAVLTSNQVQPPALSPLEEAVIYFDEARWALRWGLYPEAQQASEASWALGLRLPELALMRLRSYLDLTVLTPRKYAYDPRRPKAPPPASGYALRCTMSSTDLAVKLLHLTQTDGKLDQAHIDAAETTLNYASEVLWRNGADTGMARKYAQELSQLRVRTRELADTMGQINNFWQFHQGNSLAHLTLRYAAFWEEDFARTKQRLLKLIDRGGVHAIIDNPVFYQDIRTYPFSWVLEERQNSSELFWQWHKELTQEPGTLRPEAGFYYQFKTMPSDYEYEDCLMALTGFLQKNRQALISGQLSDKLWETAIEYMRDKSLNKVISRLQTERLPEVKQFLDTVMKERKVFMVQQKNAGKVEAFRAAMLSSIKGDRPDLGKLYGYDDDLELTPAQAQELDGLLAECVKKSTLGNFFSFRLQDKIDKALNRKKPSRSVAVSPRTTQGKAPAPATNVPPGVLPYQSNLVANIPGAFLQLLPGKYPGEEKVDVVSQEYDGSHGWFEVKKKGWGSPQRFLLRVNLANMQTNIISIPVGDEQIQYQMPLVKTTVLHGDAVFSLTKGHLMQLSPDLRSWQDVGVTLPADCQLFSVSGSLIARSPTSLLLIDLKKKTVAVLASIRRRPAMNVLDQADSLANTTLMPGPDGSIGVLSEKRLFNYSLKSQKWTEVSGILDPGQWKLIPGREGILFEPRYVRLGEYMFMGWNDQQPSLRLDAMLEGHFFSPPSFRQKAQSHWVVPDDLLTRYRLPNSGVLTQVRAASVQWETDSLWVLFAANPTDLAAPPQPYQPPCLMICSEQVKNPLICPLGLIVPQGWTQTQLPQTAHFSLTLAGQYVVFFASDMPAVWALPRRSIEPFLHRSAKVTTLANEQRYKELLQRQKKWREIFDRDHDGRLDEREMQAMQNHPMYKKNMEELQKLEEQHKESR